MRTSLYRTILAVGFLVLSSSLFAAETDANSQKGKVLHDKFCMSCHVGMFGKDGSAIYTRGDRKVHSFAGLEAQIGNCNHNLGLNLTEQQLAHILSYLNQSFYKYEDM